jgi:outer membrane protein assembly factor BamD
MKGLADSRAPEYVPPLLMRRFAPLFATPLLLGAGLVGLAVLAGSLAGCEGEPPKTALGYTDSAKHAYDLAMEQFNAHDWLLAENALREVKRKYSYSKYARLAELRLADLDFLQEKYPEAIHGYKDFIHTHRSDSDDITYAREKIAEAMVAEIPESALLPASEERDQATVVDAYKELKSYLADYPTAKEAPKMRALLSQVTARLVRHELYVARYYAHLDNPDATIARIRYAMTNYALGGGPSAGGTNESADLEAESLILLGETYLRMHKWTEARDAFQSILQRYSESSFVVPARNYLATLASRGV